ncbi:MAG: nitrilase-related carbon-nitrogen hydrolase [Bacteroidales bacterium]
MKIGYVQFNPVLGDPELNCSKLKELLSETDEADLVVLPELANSGYNFRSRGQAVALSETISGSSFVEFIAEIAQMKNQYIVSGILERDGAKLFNTAFLAGPKGYMGKYRKLHLFWNEFDFFEKGNLGLPLFDIGHCRIGILICFDWIFPEVWRILGLKRAGVICHPSNLVLPYAQQAVPVHAMMNRYFVITANRYGTEGEVTFSGRSFISDPFGQIIRMAPPETDEVGIQEIDLRSAIEKNITPRNHLFQDRRPDQYTEIII